MNKLNYLITKLPNLPQHRKPTRQNKTQKAKTRVITPKKKEKKIIISP